LIGERHVGFDDDGTLAILDSPRRSTDRELGEARNKPVGNGYNQALFSDSIPALKATDNELLMERTVCSAIDPALAITAK
jgi:hypothetical protein